ncbi:hypothetical protein NR800_11820 [Corallococcus interemptor]|uniref:hypothetical protein n=1 Tax=Corallococcus interemptor TaxID=2316720 RepID=UPI0035D43A32
MQMGLSAFGARVFAVAALALGVPAVAQESNLGALIEKTQESITRTEVSPIPVRDEAIGKPTPLKSTTDVQNIVNDKLTAILNEESARKSKNTEAKYSNGAELLSSIHGSASTVLLITQLLGAESGISKATNLWADEDFRNAYDNVRDWGTVAGTVAAVVGGVVTATGNEGTSKAGAWTLAGGAGVIGLSQLAGLLGGNESGDKMKKKAQHIELTRRAYDDLSARVDMVLSLEASNSQFQAELESFQLKYRKLENFKADSEQLGSGDIPKSVLQERALGQLAAVVERFSVVVAQIDQILNSYEVLVNKYDNSGDPYPVPNVVKEMKVLRVRLQKARSNYQIKVKPFLERHGEITAVFGTGI